jgi:hypothetical protein
LGQDFCSKKNSPEYVRKRLESRLGGSYFDGKFKCDMGLERLLKENEKQKH